MNGDVYIKVGNEVAIFRKTLLALGLPENTLNVAISRNKKGASNSYSTVKLNNQIAILLNTIPRKTRTKYNIEITEKEKLNNAISKVNHIKSILQKLNNSITENHSAYIEYYDKSGKKNIDKDMYAEQHALMIKCVELSDKDMQFKYSLKDIHIAYLRAFVKGKKIRSYNYFSTRIKHLRELIKSGHSNVANYLLNGNIDNHNAQKLTATHIWLIEWLYAQPKRLSSPKIHYMVNFHCNDWGLNNISHSSVKQHIALPDVQNRRAHQRYGNSFFQNHISPHVPRIVAPFAGDLYMIDGTPLQFYCLDKNNKRIRLCLFVVLDVCTRKVVGFSIDRSEDRFMIMDALQMAFDLNGHLPAEILSDNFSANKTEEIGEIKDELISRGVLWRHSKVGNARDKTHVERFFGTFQSEICSLFDDYMGEGITSKRKDARPDPYHLQKTIRLKGVSTEKEMRKRIAKMLGMYNDLEIAERLSPNERYTNSEKPNVKSLEIGDVAYLFWNKTTVSIRQSMVRIVVRKVEYQYRIFDHDIKLKLNTYKSRKNYKVDVRYDEKDMSEIHLYDIETGDFIYTCKQYVTGNVASIHNGEDEQLAMIKNATHHKAYKTHIDKINAEVEKSAMLEAPDNTRIVKDILLTDKYNRNTIESEQMQNYFFDRNDIDEDVKDFEVSEPKVFELCEDDTDVDTLNEVSVLNEVDKSYPEYIE